MCGVCGWWWILSHAFNFPFSSHNESKCEPVAAHSASASYIVSHTLILQLWASDYGHNLCADSPHDAFRLLTSPFNSNSYIYIYYFFFVAFAFGARQGEKLLLLWTRDIGRGLNFVGNPLHTGALLLQCVLCAQWLLPPSLLQNLIQFLCSFRLRWCVCSGECIYLMKTLSLPLYLSHSLRAIFLAAGNSTKPTANATSNTITVRANRLVSKTNRNKGKIALRSGVQPALELTTSIEHWASSRNTQSVE